MCPMHSYSAEIKGYMISTLNKGHARLLIGIMDT